MRFVIASIVCAAELVIAFFLTLFMRSKDLPTGGLTMIVFSAVLAWTWIAITRYMKPKPH